MSRLIRPHADSGALAGLGLLVIAGSLVLALGLGSSAALLEAQATPDPVQTLRNLLAAIRVGG
jgi:hypothetical protein